MSKVITPGELLIDFVGTDIDKKLIECENFIKKAGGAPANVAVAIKKMGAEAYMLGAVGDDQFGYFLENSIKKYGVNTEMLVKIKDCDTTLAFISLTSNGERDFRFNRGADAKFAYTMVNPKLLEEANVFHFGSATAFMGDELEKTYYKLLEYGVKNKKIITFDPNYRSALFGNKQEIFINHCKEFIKHVDVLKVSDEEAEIITGTSDVENAAKKLVSYGAKYVLVTLGSKGTLIACADRIEHIPTVPVKMVDATGAGDSFVGTVIARLAITDDLSYEAMKSYVELGNKVGAITVQKYGALDSIPYIEDLE